MQHIIKNVICLTTVSKSNILSPVEIKKKKQDDLNYQDYVVLACNKYKYNLVFINKLHTTFTIDNGVINIDDEIFDVHIKLTKENITDTIIFQGQSNDNLSSECIALMQSLEAFGFIIFNPIQTIINASDKFLSSSLLAVHNVPQPRYIIVNKSIMIDEECKGIKDSFYDMLHSLYEGNNTSINSFNKDGDNKQKYVVKTLDGSLGIGVFICDDSEIISILQTIFTLKEDVELVIQEFKENDGDIRCHLFSMDLHNYDIIGVMKRNKISGDFRSNVSLGATTNEYELDAEQQKIVMNAARASKCKWVGIDLMHCKDGSNVVIEYNSSPGVEGISAQLKKNMFEIVFEHVEKYFASNKTNESIIESANGKLMGETYKGNYFFKNVILISASNDNKTNDALLYLQKFCQVNNINLTNFVASDIKSTTTKTGCIINDGHSSISCNKDSKNDTIVITRSSVINYEDAIEACRKLENLGMIVLNGIDSCLIADDKYKMYELFKKNHIACSRSVLVSAKDNDNDLDEKLMELYEDTSELPASSIENIQYVIKILNGHGGSGVSLTTGKYLRGILQTIFAIDPERKLLLQRFEESLDGDIRVHVITYNGNQKIICAMKRNKISGDFRSNVSLGATTENIELTEEQKTLALQTAKVSGMVWCAVDIMPIQQNVDGYENVVVEFNDSAGVYGISNQIGVNIFNVIFDTIESLKNDTTNNTEPKVYSNILEAADVMYKWFEQNFGKYYDHNHGQNKECLKKCDLIGGKEVKADCSGFIGAVLCLMGLTDDPCAWNVRHGSFNLNGHVNNVDKMNTKGKMVNQNILTNLKYMHDIPGWKTIKMKEQNNFSECEPGDIIYDRLHVAIVKDKGAKHVYQWGKDTLENDNSKLGDDVKEFAAYWRRK